MIPRCFGKSMSCAFCKTDVWNMEHIWLDCPLAQQLLSLLKSVYNFDCCKEDILFGYLNAVSNDRNKVNIMLGLFVETLWSEFWAGHFDHRPIRSAVSLLIAIRSRSDFFLKHSLQEFVCVLSFPTRTGDSENLYFNKRDKVLMPWSHLDKKKMPLRVIKMAPSQQCRFAS